MKNQKNAYWIVTGLLCFGMLLGGTGQIYCFLVFETRRQED
jgi:hypothetical protein